MTTAAPDTTVDATATGWDTNLFLVRGDDRTHLRDRIAELIAFLDDSPDVPPADLGATLAADLAPGGARLAVVAKDVPDLRKKLARAAEKLADPACKQIRDAAGVYFAAEPLAEQGTLALLFPGEGAQYLNMLADLCPLFPEVEETFAWSDRICDDAGRPEMSLRRILHVPADVTREQKQAAEARLRRIGPSLLGVLSGDMAIYRVLENLKLPTTAVAGHSVGELAALIVTGALQADESTLGGRLLELTDTIDRQESEPGGPDVTLLAVGAGKAAVVAVADAVAGGAVLVAMDNCPHQCIAVGPTHLVVAVETALAEKGVLCERLPFHRPYHTPLFEPSMGPFRQYFDGIPFAAPQLPIYSCGTTDLFPADAEAVRALAVNGWVAPVEFTRMIERMYADGVRVFVEAGPRGNLTAFVEDILRGKPFAAVPANLPRRSGATQLNHLVGQLAAHGVPVDAGYLFAHRDTRRAGDVSPLFGSPLMPPTDQGTAEQGTHVPRSPTPTAINAYLDSMDQFLDVQREVMAAFFAGHPTESLPADVYAPAESTPAPKAYALVGEVMYFEPGREIVFRRPLDLREDLYVDHHTLGGRGVSRVDPGQNGLPVLPMTFSLEAMAEAAALLVPGKVVTAVRNVRLHRWVPFDAEPTVFEVRATVTGPDEVTVNVRDLGNSFQPDGADKPSSEAVVVLADDYPEPPPALPFTLTDEVPCRSTVDDLRRNMFHGPVFQMIRSLDRCGKEGIEGTLEVQPRDTWFASEPDPLTLLDPVLTDAAMHILGAWHLEQPDWSGRILLPFEVKAAEYFGPPPEPGTPMLVRGHNEQETARYARHGLELFTPDGRSWLRLTGAGYWRFYLPFGDVNFFGPKDEYFLTSDFPELVPPGADGSAKCRFLEIPTDLKQAVLRASGVCVTMTPRENAEYMALDGPESAKDDWFFARLVGKDAVRAVWYAKHGRAMYPADLESELSASGRLTCEARGEAEPYPPVAVAVGGGCVVALAADAPHLGVGVCAVAKKNVEDDEADFTPAEAELLGTFENRAEARARFRAARRAVGSAGAAGGERPAVVAADPATGLVRIALPAGTVSDYAEGIDRPVRVTTARRKDVIAAATLCETDPA